MSGHMGEEAQALRLELQHKDDHDLLVETAVHMRIATTQLEKLNGRVSALERWRSWLTGGVGALTAVGLLAWQYIQAKLP